MPAGSADWLRLGLGDRNGAFAAAIFAWSVVACAYFLLLFLSCSLSSGRRPPAGLLNPSGLGLGMQNVLMACLVWPVMLLRVTATLWWPDEITTLAPGILAQWLSYEHAAFLSSTTLGYAPVCALIGIPAIITLPQTIIIALAPAVNIWLAHYYKVKGMSHSEIGAQCGVQLFLGAGAFCITYVMAQLPMLMFKTSRVERALSRQRDLVMGTIAHDIGTPLTALILAVDSLKPTADGPLAVEAYEAIDISLHTIGQLCKTILNYVVSTQQGTDLSPPQMVPIDVADLVQSRILPLLTQLVKGRGDASLVACRCEVGAVAGADALQVVADPDWLVDMLLNLIGNAAKFTSSGHIAVKCFARARDAPGLGLRPITRAACRRAAWEVVFAVEDTGPGVSEHDASQLFQPFRQVAGTRGGTGLGRECLCLSLYI